MNDCGGEASAHIGPRRATQHRFANRAASTPATTAEDETICKNNNIFANQQILNLFLFYIQAEESRPISNVTIWDFIIPFSRLKQPDIGGNVPTFISKQKRDKLSRVYRAKFRYIVCISCVPLVYSLFCLKIRWRNGSGWRGSRSGPSEGRSWSRQGIRRGLRCRAPYTDIYAS